MIKAKHLLLMVGAMAMVLATAPLAKAVALELEIGDQYYLGSVDPGTPANETNETMFVNYLKDMGIDTTDTVSYGQPLGNQTYIRSSTDFGLMPEADGATKTEPAVKGTEIAFGWDYVLGKYGQGISHVWYIAGLMENFTITWDSAGGQGLSHYTLFNARQVPDGGKTLLLLGLGLAGMIGMRRRMEA